MGIAGSERLTLVGGGINMSLQCNPSTQNPAVTVAMPSGRMDTLTSEQIGAELIAALTACSAGLLVDMSGVPYLSSAGLRAFVTLGKTAAATGKKIALFNVPPAIFKLFKLTSLDQALNLSETESDALAAIG
jgi:anti-anti-sigma factor